MFQLLVQLNTTLSFIALQIKSTPQEDGLLLDEFEESVTMSTYLVAFIVADLSNVSHSINGTEVGCSNQS